MTDKPLQPAAPGDVAFAIEMAISLNHRGRPKRGVDRVQARILAERIRDHLRLSNFVVMQGTPREPHSVLAIPPT